MDSPPALAQAFDIKARELLGAVRTYLSPELQLGALVLEKLPADTLVAQFDQHVGRPHAARIRARDEPFLLSDAVGTDPTILALKSAWPRLPEDVKARVWKLLTMLTAISARYAELTAA